MFRLWYLTFLGAPRSETGHHHATPLSMLVPLVILAALSVCGGWIGIERFSAYLAPVAAAHRPMPEGNPGLEFILSIAAVLVALEGWLIADKYYRRKPERPRRSPPSFPPATSCL
jgi:NADH-quinone oxidoreductase subunit L